MTDIRTCAASLLHAGTCCTEVCQERATVATIDLDHVEHARCSQHGEGADLLASKPLVWDPDWAPPGRHTHAWSREVAGLVERAELEVGPSGVVVLSEEVVAQLMLDAGWERAS